MIDRRPLEKVAGDAGQKRGEKAFCDQKNARVRRREGSVELVNGNFLKKGTFLILKKGTHKGAGQCRNGDTGGP